MFFLAAPITTRSKHICTILITSFHTCCMSIFGAILKSIRLFWKRRNPKDKTDDVGGEEEVAFALGCFASSLKVVPRDSFKYYYAPFKKIK